MPLGEDDELSVPPVGAGHERMVEEARELTPLRAIYDQFNGSGGMSAIPVPGFPLSRE